MSWENCPACEGSGRLRRFHGDEQFSIELPPEVCDDCGGIGRRRVGAPRDDVATSWLVAHFKWLRESARVVLARARRRRVFWKCRAVMVTADGTRNALRLLRVVLGDRASPERAQGET